MKKNKIIQIIIFLIILTSCGFKPINQKNMNLIFFKSIVVKGDPRITGYLKNNISIVSNKNSENKYDLRLNIEKKKSIKIKDITGKTTRYTMSLIANLELVDLQKNKLNKTFVQYEDYDVATIHSTTIQNESGATKIIIQKLSDDIINFIILSMRNK